MFMGTGRGVGGQPSNRYICFVYTITCTIQVTDLWTFPPRYRQVATDGVVLAISQVQSWLTQANYWHVGQITNTLLW